MKTVNTLNSNIEIHKLNAANKTSNGISTLNSNIEIHKWISIHFIKKYISDL